MSLAYADRDYVAVSRRRRPVIERLESVTDPVSVAELTPPAPTQRPQWADIVVARILDLSALGANWDRRGSAAVKPEVLMFVLDLLNGTMSSKTIAPSVVPLGSGGVQLVWLSQHWELEVEIDAPPAVTISLHDRASGAESESRADTDYSELSHMLETKFTP